MQSVHVPPPVCVDTLGTPDTSRNQKISTQAHWELRIGPKSGPAMHVATWVM